MCAIRIHIHAHTDKYTQSIRRERKQPWSGTARSSRFVRSCRVKCTLAHNRCQDPCRTATHCSTLQCTAACCCTLQHKVARSHTLQRTATRCNSLQHTATLYNIIFVSRSLSHTYTHTHTLAHTTGAPHLHLSVGRKIARRTARRARGSRWHNGFQRQRVHLCRSVVLRVVACCCSVLSRAQRSRQHSDFSGRGYMRIALCCNVLLCVAISTKKSSTWRISESSRMSSP